MLSQARFGPTVLCKFVHRQPTQFVCVTDCYFIVTVQDLSFASPITIYRLVWIEINVKLTLNYLTCGISLSFCPKSGFLSDFEGF